MADFRSLVGGTCRVDDLRFMGVAPVAGLEKQARSPAAAVTFECAGRARGATLGSWEVEQVV
jgi:hypothetical protein